MLFEEKKQEKRLAHVLDKYAKIASSDSEELLLRLPREEYWRFFIDGNRQQSSRGIRKAFVETHGEELVSNLNFLSLTINEYIVEYHHKRKIYFVKNGKPKTIYRLLQSKFYLNDLQFYLLLRLKLDSGNATLREVLLLDQAWLAFEINEPHYLVSVFKAFFTVVNENDNLSIELIKRTHAILGTDVLNTNYDDTTPKPGNFRDSPYIAFGLAKSNASLAGIKELLERKNKAHCFVICVKEIKSKSGFTLILDHETIQDLKKNHTISECVRIDSDGMLDHSSLDPENNRLDAVLLDLASKVAEAKSKQDLSELFYSFINGTYTLSKEEYYYEINYAYEAPAENTQLFYESTLQLLIEDYYDNLERAKSDLAKLRVIVTFTQRCEQLHPFDDMNCRLFCMVILNHLLKLNGFPYVIQADPNRFDLFSTDELIADMITGMKKTFELVETDVIYGVDTEHLLKAIESSPRFNLPFNTEFKAALAVIDEILATPAPTRGESLNYNN